MRSTLLEGVSHRLHNRRLPDLPAGQIHGQANRSKAGVLPGLALRTRSVEHPLTERDDQTGFFGDRNELGGGHGAQLRVLPAQQGLMMGRIYI